MTETQAKSGAEASSTEADEPSAEASGAEDHDKPRSLTGTTAQPSVRATEADRSSTGTVSYPEGVSYPGGLDSSHEPEPAEPEPAWSASPVSPSTDFPRSTEPERVDEPTVRTFRSLIPPSTDIPVVAGPTPGVGATPPAGAGPPPRSAGSYRGTTVPPPETRPPAGGTGPIIARAPVTTPPPGGTSTVTGAGSRSVSPSSAVGAPSRFSPGSVGAAIGAGAAVGAARVSDAMRTARATVAGAATRGPRRARLHLKRIDPWSVMKFSFAVSLVLFVVAIVATSVLYLALDAMDVFAQVNKAFADLTGEAGTTESSFKITAKGVIGTSVLLGAVNMVLFTALMTLGAFVYNVCADLVGGVELTLSEKE